MIVLIDLGCIAVLEVVTGLGSYLLSTGQRDIGLPLLAGAVVFGFYLGKQRR